VIFRRLAQHLKEQNWTAIAIEFVLLVLGVFLGIQVANWNEERLESARQAIYLERLRTDVLGIRERMLEHITTYRAQVEGADYLLSLLRASDGEFQSMAVDKERVGRAFDGLTSIRIPPAAPATYSEMLSEGQLSSIRDPALRDALAAYDRLSGVVAQVSRNVSDFKYQSDPVLYRHFVVNVVADGSKLSRIRDDVVSFDIEAMRQDPEFASVVTLLRRNGLNSWEQRKLQMQLVEQILALLEKERAP
jgi:hypothetical protein